MTPEYYFCHGDRVTVVHEFHLEGEDYAVCDMGDSYLSVHPKRDLKKWEDTYQYTEHEKIKAQTRELEDRKQEVIDKLKKEAVEALTFRLKLNSAFAKDGNISNVGLTVAKELEKIIKEKQVKL